MYLSPKQRDEMIDELLNIARDTNKWTRSQDFEIIRKLEPTQKFVSRYMEAYSRSKDLLDRVVILELLSEVGGKRAIQHFYKVLESNPPPLVRRYAYFGLIENDQPVIDLLVISRKQPKTFCESLLWYDRQYRGEINMKELYDKAVIETLYQGDDWSWVVHYAQYYDAEDQDQ